MNLGLVVWSLRHWTLFQLSFRFFYKMDKTIDSNSHQITRYDICNASYTGCWAFWYTVFVILSRTVSKKETTVYMSPKKRFWKISEASAFRQTFQNFQDIHFSVQFRLTASEMFPPLRLKHILMTCITKLTVSKIVWVFWSDTGNTKFEGEVAMWICSEIKENWI